MGRSKVNRTGERAVNNFGSEMVIVKYNNKRDIDVYFPEYDWIAKNTRYDVFKNGNIKCPYEKRYYGIGYIGEGKYKACENGKDTRVYKTWHHMLERCYDNTLHISAVKYQRIFIIFKTLLNGTMTIIMKLKAKEWI